MHFLQLPDEILLNVVVRLAAQDVLSFASVNAKTRDFFRDSNRLRYIVELEAAGCWDPYLGTGSPCKNATRPAIPIVERLRYLRTREKNWREMRLLRNAVNINFPRVAPIQLYDLSAGYFFWATRGLGKGFEYVDLRSVTSQKTPIDTPAGSSTFAFFQNKNWWQHFHFDGLILDFGLSLHENDLVAIVDSDTGEDG